MARVRITRGAPCFGPALPFHDGFNWLCPACDRPREIDDTTGVCVECLSEIRRIQARIAADAALRRVAS